MQLKPRILLRFALISCLVFYPNTCCPYLELPDRELVVFKSEIDDKHLRVIFKKQITIGQYFSVIDSLVSGYNLIHNTCLTEHTLIHFNPWVIDSLAATDYYLMKERGNIIKEQSQLVIFHEGDSLNIPDSIQIALLRDQLDSIRIDVNIPEFRIRIYSQDSILSSFPVRVGQNRKRYLELVGREVDLRTQRGSGHIIRHVRNPYFINPVDGKHFTQTRRDDGIVTEMPSIPWMETELNGIRTGNMIHPTTNLITLEKPYSNGCIATRESDAWRIYYYAPIGTRISVRYQLKVTGLNGEEIHLKDIYHLSDYH